MVATFLFRGPDSYDEAQEDILIATVALDEAREEQSKLTSRLEDAREDMVDVHCRLESALIAYDNVQRALDGANDDLQLTHAELVESQRAYRAIKESLWELEDEHEATIEQLRHTYRGHAEQGRQQRIRAALAGMGGKCATLVANPSVSLITIAYAAVARHHRATKLLAIQRTRHDAEVAALVEAAARQTMEHAIVVRSLKDTVGEQRVREMTLDQELKALRRDLATLHTERTSQHSLVDKVAAAEGDVEALKKKLEKTMARSREVSTRLFKEKTILQKELAEEREAAAAPPTCSICMENAHGLVCFFPCGHASVCTGCESALTHCPVCRCDIQHRTQLFMCAD